MTTSTTFRIMPLGDSITRGLISPEPGYIPGGYRTRLHHRLRHEHPHFREHRFGFVGTADDNPDPQGGLPDPHHEGHGGWRIDEIANQIDIYLESCTPNLVLMHLGTNDMVQNHNVEQAPHRWRQLIDRIHHRMPTCLVLAAQIIRSSDAQVDDRVRSFNAALEKNCQSSPHPRLHLVNMYDAVNVDDLVDPYHPGKAGYDKIADRWYEAILMMNLKK